jgi:hypothetical protein
MTSASPFCATSRWRTKTRLRSWRSFCVKRHSTTASSWTTWSSMPSGAFAAAPQIRPPRLPHDIPSFEDHLRRHGRLHAPLRPLKLAHRESFGHRRVLHGRPPRPLSVLHAPRRGLPSPHHIYLIAQDWTRINSASPVPQLKHTAISEATLSSGLSTTTTAFLVTRMAMGLSGMLQMPWIRTTCYAQSSEPIRQMKSSRRFWKRTTMI